MVRAMSRRLFAFPLLAGFLLSAPSGCSSDSTQDASKGGAGGQGGGGVPGVSTGDEHNKAPSIESVEWERLFPTEANEGIVFTDCTTASPIVYAGKAGAEIVIASSDRVVGLDKETGSVLYSITLPAPEGERAFAVSTPALVGDKLVVAYHTTLAANESANPGRDLMDKRASQIVAVLDLEERKVDESFPFVALAAKKPSAEGGHTVDFRADKSLQRGKLAHVKPGPGESLGSVIVTFGNARDLQPWHGWAFALSLDTWKDAGAEGAVTRVLLVTPEHDCGPEGSSGSRARICGGGLWSPSGALVIERGGDTEIILAPGNGKLDLSRGDYANTLLRTGKDLEFSPGCDTSACADFDPDRPSLACVESCDSVFVPRIPVGEPELSPESGVCDGLPMFACWEKMDYVGGSTPAYVETEGQRLLVYPTKDGHAYLVDADHLGTLHQRKELVKVCGTGDDECRADWAGMIVAQPAVGRVNGKAMAFIPTFMPDATHPAGVFGLRVEVREGKPSLETAWIFPDPESPEALTRFRMHPSQVTLAKVGEAGAQALFLVEPATGGMTNGKLLALRPRDGKLLGEVALAGKGRRFIEPLVHEDVVYAVSCESDRGRSFVEAHRLVAQ